MFFWSVNFTLAYVAIIALVSIYLVKKVILSYEEYSLCSRSVSIFYVIVSYFSTWIGGGTLVVLTSISYEQGIASYWLMCIPFIVGFLFAFLFITRIRSLAQFGLGDMMSLRYPEYNQIVRLPVAAAILVRNVTVIGMQFGAVSLLVEYIMGINRNLATLIIFIFFTAYTALNGLRGVLLTDVFQGIFQAIGMLILFFGILHSSGGVGGILTYFADSGDPSSLSLFNQKGLWSHFWIYICTIGIFFLFSDQSDWQRINSSKSDKVAFWGFLVPLCLSMIWLLIPAYVGVFHHVSGSGAPDGDFLLYQMVLGNFQAPLAAFLLVCIISSVMSSVDSFLLTSGITFSRDVIKQFINPTAKDRELLFWSRFFTLITGGIGFAFAICITNLIRLWIIGMALSTAIILVPYLMAWFYKRATTLGAFCGMLAGGASSILSFFMLGVDSLAPVWIGILVNLAVCLVVGLFAPMPKDSAVRETYYWSEKFRNTKNIPG